MMEAFSVMAYRQIKRFVRARSRLVGMIINPLIWIVFFGLGWSKVFDFPYAEIIFGGVDYLTFLSPGVMSMTIFATSFVAGISVIWDKQFGFLKEVLVAPSSRSEAMAGRIVGDSLIALLQGAIILGLMFILASDLNPAGILPAAGLGFLVAVSFSSLGVTIALKMRSMEGFQMLINFITLPLLFLSGAFYPITTMPEWMKVMAYFNPLTYAVDGMRYFLTGTSVMHPMIDVLLLALLSIVLLAVAMLSFRKATIE